MTLVHAFGLVNFFRHLSADFFENFIIHYLSRVFSNYRPLTSMDNIDFDKEKRPQKLAKNRRMPNDPNAVKRRSTLAIRLFLKEFCVEFLHGAYNNLMSVVRDNVVRQKAQNNDETYYLWSMKFFMEFNRECKFRPDLVTETLNKSSFHFVQTQIMNYKDNYEHEKKNRPMCLIWARRMHLGKIW